MRGRVSNYPTSFCTDLREVNSCLIYPAWFWLPRPIAMQFSVWGPLSHHTEQNMYVSSQLCSPYSHPLILKKNYLSWKNIQGFSCVKVLAVWKFRLQDAAGCRVFLVQVLTMRAGSPPHHKATFLLCICIYNCSLLSYVIFLLDYVIF